MFLKLSFEGAVLKRVGIPSPELRHVWVPIGTLAPRIPPIPAKLL